MENEKRKKRRNRIGGICITAAAVIFMMLPGTACSSSKGYKGRSIVRIDVIPPNAIKFDRYSSVIYKDLAMDVRMKNFDPDEAVTTFFMDELARTTRSTFVPFDSTKHARLAPGQLLISGSMKLAVKERSKIEDVKNEKGKGKSRKFIKVQHWDLTMEIILTEGTEDGKGKEIYKKNFSEKTADANPESAKFNFEDLFFKITNRFTRQVTTVKRTQRRYLLQ